jgi:hypothetical protein
MKYSGEKENAGIAGVEPISILSNKTLSMGIIVAMPTLANSTLAKAQVKNWTSRSPYLGAYSSIRM